MIPALVLSFLVVLIGESLSAGTEIVYQSGGAAQTPWVYDTVEVVQREGFDRCVRVQRRGMSAREHCARADSLFERRADGGYAFSRPIGGNMKAEVAGANGSVLRYTTAHNSLRLHAGGVSVIANEAVITTVDSTGKEVRRLTELYAPALLTAVRGTFEEPDTASPGGWRVTREFSIREIKRPR